MWEEYLWTVLKESKLKFKHPRNKTGEGKLRLFSNNNAIYFPDFYSTEESIVLDAKYKLLEEKEIWQNRNDLYQLISYMHVLPAQFGAFIFPSKNINSSIQFYQNNLFLNGQGGNINAFALQIPQNCNTWKDFCNAMKKSEREFIYCIFSVISTA